LTGIQAQLPAFVLGYAAILAVPGPNMLALGGLAALRGFHAAAPFALGAASGATALAVATQAAIAVLAEPSWVFAVRGAGVLLLVVLALRIFFRSRAMTDGNGRASTSLVVEAGTGFCTALGNPITIAYFAAEYASFPAASPIGFTVAAIVAVPLTSATFYLGICALLAAPGIRRIAVMKERLIRCATAAVLIVMAIWGAWGTVTSASGVQFMNLQQHGLSPAFLLPP
jgi:homoserine/homoserine lactone efflux protein